MTPQQAQILAGWRRLEKAARECGNTELAEQAAFYAERIANPPPTSTQVDVGPKPPK